MPAHKEKTQDKGNVTDGMNSATTVGEMPSGEMPQGKMTEREAGAMGGEMQEMPRGEMTEGEAGTMGATSAAEMPRGDMVASQSGEMGETTAGEMPRGEMTEGETKGSLGAVELPGLWRLTMSPFPP